jgi:hypothetical protein
MPPTDWLIFVAFVMSLTLLIVGPSGLLCAEEIQRYGLGGSNASVVLR